MKYKVLESFDYAHDGVRPNRLKAGKFYPIQPEHVARFQQEGKIERPAGLAPFARGAKKPANKK